MAGPVRVQVRGVQGRAGPADRLAVDLPRGCVPRYRHRRRPMELVTCHHLTHAGQQRVADRNRVGITQREPVAHRSIRCQSADHRRAVQGRRQVQQTRAFSHGRHTGLNGSADIGHQGGIRRQVAGVHLGETAPEIDPAGALGQLHISQRIEGHDVGSGSLEQLLGLGVAKGERPSAGHGDHRAPLDRCDSRAPGLGFERRCGTSHLEHRLKINVGCDLLPQQRDQFGGRVTLGHRHQTEVPRRCCEPIIARDDAQHREPQRARDLSDVSSGSGPVQDDSGDLDARVVRNHPSRDRTRGSREPGDVHDQHHGRTRQRGDMRRGREAVPADLPVIETHDALDHRDVGTARTVQQ